MRKAECRHRQQACRPGRNRRDCTAVHLVVARGFQPSEPARLKGSRYVVVKNALVRVDRMRHAVPLGIAGELILGEHAAETELEVRPRSHRERTDVVPANRDAVKRGTSSPVPTPGSKRRMLVHGSPRAIFASSCTKTTGPWTIVDPINVG